MRSAAAPNSAPSMQWAVRSRSTRRGERQVVAARLFVVTQIAIEEALDLLGRRRSAERPRASAAEVKAYRGRGFDRPRPRWPFQSPATSAPGRAWEGQRKPHVAARPKPTPGTARMPSARSSPMKAMSSGMGVRGRRRTSLAGAARRSPWRRGASHSRSRLAWYWRHVHRGTGRCGHHPLPERRRIDVAQDAVGERAGIAQGGGFNQVAVVSPGSRCARPGSPWLSTSSRPAPNARDNAERLGRLEAIEG